MEDRHRAERTAPEAINYIPIANRAFEKSIFAYNGRSCFMACIM